MDWVESDGRTPAERRLMTSPPSSVRESTPIAGGQYRWLPARHHPYAICVSTQVTHTPTGGEFQSAVGMLKLLGDETRLRIIWALLGEEHSVNELAELVGAQPAGVSQHLAKLRLAQLVRSRREGTRIFYVADDAHVRSLVSDVLSHADHVVRSARD
jgi:DNA-binding transcriptional ArsR family regulator